MDKKKPLLKYYLCVIAAGMCWGLTGTLQGLAPQGASSLTIGSARMASSGFFLLLFMLAKRDFSIFRQRWDVPGLFIAALAQAAYQLFFFSAVRLTGVALGTMIAIGASPAIAGLLGRFFFKERLPMTWYISTVLAVAGCAMLIFGGGGLRVDFPGCILALGAAVSYTFVGVGLRRVGNRDAVQTATFVFTIAGAAMLPLLALSDTSWIASLHGLSIVLVISIVASILPLMLFTAGVQKIPLGRAYTLSLTEPLTASLLAVIVLNEQMSALSAAGAALVFVSIYILSRK